jgi:hypothetical protein
MAKTKRNQDVNDYSLKGGFHPWLKDIDPRSRGKETAIRIQDQAQNCLSLEYLFRKLVSFLMQSEARM